MTKVSILTPTYNRKHLLNKLYLSLCNQDCMSFEWVIVDDGSNDGTREFVETLCALNTIEIRYLYKENGGKHTALNTGIRSITNPLTFIVDSDDYLTTDAVSTILKTFERFKEENDLCGFSFLRAKPNGELLCDSEVPEDGIKETYVECRINRKIGGDMAEVWYTDCLKECPFPEFKSEKFLGEDVVWIRLAEKYKLKFFNKIIYISDYLEDGLTKNRRKNNIKSPEGCICRAEVFLESNACFVAKIKAGLQYTIYGKFAGYSAKDILKKSKYNGFVMILFLPALILFFVWTKKYGKKYR